MGKLQHMVVMDKFSSSIQQFYLVPYMEVCLTSVNLFHFHGVFRVTLYQKLAMLKL